MYESQLDTPADRFLSLCLQHAVTESWLSAEDFNQEFPATVLMAALESDDELRAQLLVEAAGVHEKIAARKSIAAAAEDLQLALDEGLCTAETILEIVNIDDHVHFLDKQQLWSFLIHDKFWDQASERARERMLFVINTALDQELINLPRLIRAINPAEFARLLPKNVIEEAFTAALQSGLDGRAFGADPFVALVPLTTWLQHVPLPHIWGKVIEAEVIVAAKLATPGAQSANEAQSKEQSNAKEQAAKPAQPAKHPQSPKESPSAKKADGSVSGAVQQSHAESKPVVPANPAEAEARDQAIFELEQIDRLPRRADYLSTPVLLALEAMYAEFFELETEEEQAECIREAFPNQKLLEEGLLALAETLDPRLSEEQLRSRGADAAGLIQLVLFEERRIARHLSSPPPTVGVPSNGPPPLPPSMAPKIGSVPPPPGDGRKVSIPPPPLPIQATRRN